MVRVAGNVRREDHVLTTHKLRGRRSVEFSGVDVRGEASQMSGLQRLRKCGLVDQLAPGHVDHERSASHVAESMAVQQMERVAGELGRKHYRITAWEHRA